MKLRTKLVLVSATVLFLASTLSGAAMTADTLRFHEVQAAESGRAQLTAAANAIDSQMESSRILEYGEVTRTAYFHFLLDKYDASRFLLLENDIVLCNQTDYEFVEGGTEGWNGEEVQSLIQKTDGRRLLICGRRIPMETTDAYSLVMIQDISGIYQDALRRIPVLAAICLTASLAASAALSLLARRLLSPLEQLRCAAVRISEGDMSCRAPISGHDEVTALACAFNHMADRVEEQMELLNRAAEQRTRLLGSLTHEIKTPMTSIIGYADTLLHVHLPEDSKKRALRHIYEEGRRLERLSSKLMLLIGLYENDSIQMEETELSELFERVRRLEACQLKRQEMVLEVSSFSGTRRVDADLFESLLVNLIDNAIRAGHRGGRIRLIRLAQDGRRGERILVQDDGKGISPEEMEKITQPFYMVDKSRSRKEGGAGLGLALCSRIAALHNLRLSIESQLEEGTTVTLEFPTGNAPENGDSPFLQTAALLLACILSAGSLSACSLAENREVVRLKEENGQDPADGPDVRPAGSGNIARQTAAPGELQLDFRDASGRLSVHVDASVTVPDAEGFRLKKVSSRSFTQADSDAVNRVLLDGGVLLGDGVLRERETMPGRAAYSVSLDNSLTPDRREIRFLVMRKDTQIGFPLLTDTGTEALPDPQALTDQAVSSLAGMEIAGFQPAGAEYVSVSRQDFTGTVLEQHNGVRIPFERMVDGIPVTYTAEAGAGVEGENVSWPYEALSFCYDAQGLVSFQWTDPCIYTDISEEYVFLLPFEEICRIFRTVFPEKYAAYASDGREADFHITRIRLGYMRIMEPGNWMEGTLIPAWDFFGYWIYGDAADSENADSNLLTEPKIPEHYLSGGLSYSLLTVNACDGTVINRSLGY